MEIFVHPYIPMILPTSSQCRTLVVYPTEAKMNGVETKMDSLEVNIEYLNKDMEGLEGGLAKFLLEMLPNPKR